jgi:hypothetical protein
MLKKTVDSGGIQHESIGIATQAEIVLITIQGLQRIKAFLVLRRNWRACEAGFTESCRLTLPLSLISNT